MNQVLQPYYEKSVLCPLCETSFHTRKIRSRFSNPYKIDADFCPYFKDDRNNPLFYFVAVCPQCGYSSSEQFSSLFPLDSKKHIWEKVSSSWKNLNFCEERSAKQAIDSYKLAIFCGELKKEKHEVMAGLCLRLAWIYRKNGEQEQEKRFMQLAVQKYEEAYLKNESFSESMSEMKVLFIIGELHRRLDQPKEAMHNFSKVIKHQNKDFEMKLVKMAREQWMLMRDQKRVEEEVPQ